MLQDGRVNLEIIGGVAPFTFTWSNGASSQDISALGGGNYTVTISDANEASLQLSAAVFEPSPISVTGNVSPLSCGDINGTIALDVTGGTAPFSYSWSNGSTERDLTGLNAGTYEVTITDANGCSLTESFTLLATSDISAVINTNDCKDGALTLEVMGGVPPFNYLWSTDEISKDIKATTTGTYAVTITDVNGCSTSTSIDVTELIAFDLSIQTTPPTCGGNSDGAIDLTVTGGQNPYTYSWSNGATSEDLTDVVSGNYTVTVTDARGCSQELTHFLRNPVSIFINAKVSPIRCDGNGNDGAIDVSIFNVTEPYTVSWSNGEIVEDLSNLTAGNYTITVVDANGCQAMKTIELAAPEDFQVDLTQQYCGDGRICPTLSGGSSPFTYNWTDQSGNVITTIDGCIEVTEAGTYNVQVIDVNGCTKSASITIGAPNPTLSTELTVTELSCQGANNASASVAITGGDGNYLIEWSTGAVNTTSINNLSAGTYTVKVTDQNGDGCREFRAF